MVPSYDTLTWTFLGVCLGREIEVETKVEVEEERERGLGLFDVSYKDMNPIGSGPHLYDLP